MIGKGIPCVRLDCSDDADGKAESVHVSPTLASYSRNIKCSSILLYCNRGYLGIISRGTRDDKGVTASASKMDEVAVLTIFSHEGGRSRFCKQL